MDSTEDRVYKLVKSEFEKMKMSKKNSNQAKLSTKCQGIIYNQWGFSNQRVWDLVNKYVEEFIPNEMD